MATIVRTTPGVYVRELDAFPPSVVGVQTAIPGFIGYTEKAERSGKAIYNTPTKIESMVDFENMFGTGYKPQYELLAGTAEDYDVMVSKPGATEADPATDEYYTLKQVNDSMFYLYNSMRLFYANGGGTCYVVSVNSYTSTDTNGSTTVNKVSLADLTTGLDSIRDQNGPTMLVVPDAVLLPPTDAETSKIVSADFQTFTRAMLKQCVETQDRVAILDVYGSTEVKDTISLEEVSTQFRTDVGDTGLNYGMAYFPFLDTSVVPVSDFNYTNITPLPSTEGTPNLTDILTWENANLNNGGVLPASTEDGTKRYQGVQANIDAMVTVADAGVPDDINTLNNNLTAALPILTNMLTVVVNMNDVLPPSGSMAGVFTATDNSKGVWNAPANVSLTSVVAPTFKVTNEQQGDLNVPVDGKAIDAIREFTGRGSVVWGARTLDGNSNDWRYIQVRRTLIYIEQSVKAALDPFVFAANDGNTWTKVTAMVSSFLQGLWSQGGLLGSTANEAYTVQCGLGSTMTGQDILDGYMIVQVTVQMIRPAEFIELTFKQTMEGVS